MIAGDFMTRNPTAVTSGTTIAEAWDLMRELDVRHIPVVDNGALVGKLSDRDLPRFDIARVLSAGGADALRRDLTMSVASVMSSDVISVDRDAELADIITLLVKNKIGAIPVIDGDGGPLIGIISFIDVLRVVAELIEAE